MKSALQVISWIAIVLGVLAILGGLTELSTAPDEAFYSLFGGLLFFTQGLLSILYINQLEGEKKND